MSDVKFCIKHLHFNIPIIYQSTAKYQTVVFLGDHYIISEIFAV